MTNRPPKASTLAPDSGSELSPPAAAPALPRRALAGGAVVAPGVALAGLFVLWAVHDGGYDNDTWYWGALFTLAMLVATVALRHDAIRLSRMARLALVSFALYVAWSYLSITWAAAKGVALQGSNRALLYLLLYALMLVLPWRRRTAQAAVGLWALGIGILAVALLVRLGAEHNIAVLLVGGRLAAPTGYINGTAALFFMGALTTTALAVPRGLPGPVRGLALAFACADLQLVLIVQSRGWLFTLPIMLLLAAAVAADRLRAAAFAALPVLGVGAILHRLLAVYSASGAQLNPVAGRAGQAGLLVCFGVFVVGTLLAWGDWLARHRSLPPTRRRVLGTALALILVVGSGGGAVLATHGHPVRFVVRQWDGFSHQEHASPADTTHFLNVGSGRYDFWRVALDAFVAHPIGGLGQDNFDDYYIARGRSGEEPSWTHSLEMRLLAHTGAAGFLFFAAFIVAAVAAALRGRHGGDPLRRAVAAAALMPAIVWLVHGSVDWFWEMPALSGPALGFLALAGGLAGHDASRRSSVAPQTHRSRAALGLCAGALATIAATLSLGLPYLATRQMSIAFNLAGSHPRAALDHLREAAELDPINSEATRTAGTVALQIGDLPLAADRFAETLRREPGDWYAYLGAGLAASGLGERATARRDYAAAARIDRFQPVNRTALKRVDTPHPMSPREALILLQAQG